MLLDIELFIVLWHPHITAFLCLELLWHQSAAWEANLSLAEAGRACEHPGRLTISAWPFNGGTGHIFHTRAVIENTLKRHPDSFVVCVVPIALHVVFPFQCYGGVGRKGKKKKRERDVYRRNPLLGSGLRTPHLLICSARLTDVGY